MLARCRHVRRGGHAGARAIRRLLAISGTVLALIPAAQAQSVEELQRLSIEQLSNIEVTSVSKRTEPISEAPAAIYVITSDDIRRSGAITLPEVLRLAPNLDVARDNAQTYAVSARGFNSTDASNKILVLIDGRAVYAPVHSGVYWDQLQVPLDDIERIEVISGPGGSVWGANAVNGVINIITKNSADTQGGLLDLKAGPVDQYGLLQYGSRFGENGSYRIYGQGIGIGATDLSNGRRAHDDWRGAQTGFRTDWQGGADQVMTQGDAYRNVNSLDGRETGGDLLARWTRSFGAGSNLQVQSSYDDQVRVTPGFRDAYRSYDLQAQHTKDFGRNLLVWGGEYRLVADDLTNVANSFVLVPARRTVGIGDIFAQDTFALRDNLKLTFGTKIEDSTYAGIDLLPSIRLGWTVSDRTFLWAAISRAVRTPSRLDRELTAPGLLAPALDFTSEKLVAYEVGYRGRPTSQTSLSVSFYYNVYDDLRTTSLSTVSGFPLELRNGEAGSTYGMEAWGDWRVRPWWRLSAGVNLGHKDLHLKPGIIDIANGQSEGYDPGHQFSLRSSMDLAHGVELDFGVREVGQLSNAPVKGYVEGDMRVAWNFAERWQLSFAAYNMFAPHHLETVTPGDPTYLPRRSAYLGLRRTF